MLLGFHFSKDLVEFSRFFRIFKDLQTLESKVDIVTAKGGTEKYKLR